MDILKILISKMDVKMNFRITTKNNANDPEIGFPTKSILKSFSLTAAGPTAWFIKFNFTTLS